MDNIIFSDYGIDILKRLERLYIRFDAGELVVHPKEIEITEEESVKAQMSEQDAYEVILAAEQRCKS